MKDNCLYYKSVSKNGKVTYTPCKVICEPDSLYTGIWYVNVDIPDIKRTSNCNYLGNIYKVGSPKIIDFEEICGLDNVTEKVLHHPDMNTLLEKSHSIYEVIGKTIAILNDLNKQKNG